MKIIGIFGKSGAGKTTLSKLIQSYDSENIEIIHLDNLYDGIKIRLFRKDTVQQSDADENRIVTVNPTVKDKVLKSKIGRAIIQRRNMLGNFLIKRKIAQARRLGKKAVIIEGIHLNNFKVTKNADAIIRVEAPFVKRLDRVSKREIETVDKAKMVFLDKVFFKGKKSKYKYFIENNDDIDKLKSYAKQIYNAEIKTKKKESSLTKKYGGYEVRISDSFFLKSKDEVSNYKKTYGNGENSK